LLDTETFFNKLRRRGNTSTHGPS